MEKYIAEAKAYNISVARAQRAKYKITPKDCYNREQDLFALKRLSPCIPLNKLKYKWLEDLNIDPTVWDDINIGGLDKEEMILQAMGLTL